LYPVALRSGIQPDRFWILSLKEIYDEMEAFEFRERETAKLQLSYMHKQAQWNAFAFSAPKTMPSLQKEFPELFAVEPEETEKTSDTPKWELDKARFALYAAAHNAQFEPKEDTSVCLKKD
jgi:hypothetical protein